MESIRIYSYICFEIESNPKKISYIIYLCVKSLRSFLDHNSQHRVLHTLKRLSEND
jgi:hypothetical protein